MLQRPSTEALANYWFTRFVSENNTDDLGKGIPNYVKSVGELNKVLIGRWNKEAYDWIYKHEGFVFVGGHGCCETDVGGKTKSVMVDFENKTTITTDEAVDRIVKIVRLERSMNKKVGTVVLLSCYAGSNGLAQRLGKALEAEGVRVLATSQIVYLTEVNPSGTHIPQRSITAFPISAEDPIHSLTDENSVRKRAGNLIKIQQGLLSTRFIATPADGYPFFELFPKK